MKFDVIFYQLNSKFFLSVLFSYGISYSSFGSSQTTSEIPNSAKNATPSEANNTPSAEPNETLKLNPNTNGTTTTSATTTTTITNQNTGSNSSDLNGSTTTMDPASAGNSATKLKSAYSKLYPTSNQLPKGGFKAAIGTSFNSSESGYSKDGKKLGSGIQTSSIGTSLAVEYGVTDKLQISISLPYSSNTQSGIDGDSFRKSQTYVNSYDNYANSVIPIMIDQNICNSESSCKTLIESDQVLPSNSEITLPTGETFTIKAGVPIKSYLDTLAFAPYQGDGGENGVGDMEAEVTYAAYSDPAIKVSVGLLVKAPTGKFEKVPTGKQAPGSGILDFGIRFKTDYKATESLFISLENKFESNFTDSNRSKASLLDGSKINEGNPISTEAVAAGSDNFENDQVYTKTGIRSSGSLRTSYGFTQSVPGSIFGAFNYDFRRQIRTNGVSTDSAHLSSVEAGLTAYALSAGIPLESTVSYLIPVMGRNVSSANTTTTIKVSVLQSF